MLFVFGYEESRHALVSASKADSGEEVLRQLESYLRYRNFLVSSSGFAEAGEGRATNIEAFLDYAQGKGNLFEFLQHLAQIATDRLNQNNRDKKNEVRLTTIHQSKGLEWQVVFVPNCNQETIPFGKKNLPEKLEEERRLFYVAITRSKCELHIHLLRSKTPSQFLKEANYKQILENIDKFQNIFADEPHLWNATDVIYLNKCINDFHLERYIRQWWDTNSYKKEQIAQTMQRFFAAAEQRQLLSVLKINSAQFDLWRSIAKIEHCHSLDFPGIEQFIHQNPENLFAKLQQGSSVNHPQYGEGTVLKVVGYARYEIITINFYTCGIKRVQITPDFCSLIRA